MSRPGTEPVVAVGAFFIKVANYTPFIPPAEPAEQASGLQAPLLQTLFSSPFCWCPSASSSCAGPGRICRSFRVPFSPVLPAIAVLACLFLMLNLTGETWLRFLVWMLAGFVVYFLYGARHSRLAPGGDRSPESETAPSRTE